MWTFQYLFFIVYSGSSSIDLVRSVFIFFPIDLGFISVGLFFFLFLFSTQTEPHISCWILSNWSHQGKPKMSFLNLQFSSQNICDFLAFSLLNWLEGEKFSYWKSKRMYLDVLAFIALSHGCTHIQHICRDSAIVLPPDFFYFLSKERNFFFNKRQLWRAFFPPERSLTDCFTKLILRFPPFQ